MQFKADKIRLQFNEEGRTEVVLTSTERALDISRLCEAAQQGKLLNVEVKRHRPRRSLDANNYMWVLCQKIAEAIGSTKEEVYRKHIRDVGQWFIAPVPDADVDLFIRRWGQRGLGWFAEVMEPSKLAGYTKIISYYGSSIYDSREMSLLIDEVVNNCREMDIETIPPEEIESLKNHWRAKDETTSA